MLKTTSTTNEQDDVEKQITQEDDNVLEKIKEKRPPGINGSLVFLYGLFFSMFTIGWINLNRCSINRLIPIYLIVAGFVGALTKFLTTRNNLYLYNAALGLCGMLCIWHILGTYWVYKEYQPNYDKTLGKFCDRTTYLLAFWILTFQYTLLGFLIIISVCYLLMKGDFKNI